MAYKHGVYVSEQETSLTTPVQGSAGLQVIFGTAPIHLADDPASAVNVPKLCYSFGECKAALGYHDDWSKFTLCQSMDACFRVFSVAPIILINVLDPTKAAHITENAAAAYTVTSAQAVYDKDYVLLSTLVVKNGEDTLVNGTDYTAAHSDDGTVLITMLSATAKALASVTVNSTSLNPDGVTASDIIGSVSAVTGAETGLELVRQIYPMLGMVPGLLLVPGWSQEATVAAALQAKTESINGVFTCNCLLDISAAEGGATVYTGVKTVKDSMGASSNHAAVLWPMLAIGSKIYYFSAVFGALAAYTDAANNDVPYKSPSNKSLKVTAVVLADGTEVLLDQEQANLLNGQGIITAINANGIKSWGNNTAAYPDTTDPKDRWLAVRRFFDWDGNNFIRTYLEKVDEPGNKRLIHSIVDSANITGNGYVARGYCAGYRVEFSDEENTITDLLAGNLTVHTYMAPYIPAEVIENVREYDTDALSAVLSGGE